MESSSSGFACIGLIADNNSWRWSTDSSLCALAETLYLESGLFLQSKEHCVEIAGGKLNAHPGIRKVSLVLYWNVFTVLITSYEFNLFFVL